MVRRRVRLGFGGAGEEIDAPDPSTKEEKLSESVNLRQDKRRILKAHGGKYILPQVCKIYALRVLTTGKAMAYFDIWGAGVTPPTRLNLTRTC